MVASSAPFMIILFGKQLFILFAKKYFKVHKIKYINHEKDTKMTIFEKKR